MRREEHLRTGNSKHLRVLRDARLVREDRVGRQRVYRLTPGRLRDVSAWVESYQVRSQRSREGS